MNMGPQIGHFGMYILANALPKGSMLTSRFRSLQDKEAELKVSYSNVVLFLKPTSFPQKWAMQKLTWFTGLC